MAKLIMTAALVAAFKRNDRKAILAETLAWQGHDEEAQLVNDASRVTVTLIDNTIECFNDEEVTELDEQADTDVAGPCDLTYADEDVEEVMTVDHDFKDIRKAIKKGKGKKALKLCKAAKEAGARGSVLKDLTRQAKEL